MVTIRVWVRAYLPEAAPGGEEHESALPEGSTVRTLLDRFGIEDAQPVIALRNGRPASADERLASGDALVLLPALDGG